MADLKNSTVLEKLIDHAKTIGDNGNSNFTAERFLAAVCDFIDGSLDCGDDNNDIDIINVMLKELDVDTEGLRDLLLNYISENKRPSISDGIYIQKKIYEAKTKALSENANELTPAVLLQCILQEPSEKIKSCIIQSQKQKENADNEEKGLQENLGELESSVGPLINGSGTDNGAGNKNVSESKQQRITNLKATVAQLVKRVGEIRHLLSESIYGQDCAINIFTSGYFQAELQSLIDDKRIRPRSTFLFAGPPGVGKTFLAEKAAEVLGLPFMRFDMSEYSDHEANLEFCASDKVYKNGKAGNVTGFVNKHPKCLLLFDEIEKAHTSVIHLFLQMLDAGRLRDNYTDDEVSFSDAIIIFTTNAGKQLYEQSELGDFSDLPRKVILNALREDINSETGAPFFPAAICSRFASGNVVMFNYIDAHNLREIARREVLKHVERFEKQVGINVEIDELVYTALMFAEGGATDARTIRSRAESFFNDELFELFRLVDSEKTLYRIEDIKNIKIEVQLSNHDQHISRLFKSDEIHDILVFSTPEIARLFGHGADFFNIIEVFDLSEAIDILRARDIKAILIDMSLDSKNCDEKYLNTEDVESESRDLFKYARSNYRDIPIYIIQPKDSILYPEEQDSFKKLGAREIIELDDDKFTEKLTEICEKIHYQSGMMYLAKSNKTISFETAQTLLDEGKTAIIKLFDFKMATAVDAGDIENVLILIPN